mmetsp:Transcript_23357/g.75935  ORF Transcript_23357/g.75935 Transcript_23357/m.75935 type:complete len:101 (-) Transcript_23357:1450-1752(-)
MDLLSSSYAKGQEEPVWFETDLSLGVVMLGEAVKMNHRGLACGGAVDVEGIKKVAGTEQGDQWWPVHCPRTHLAGRFMMTCTRLLVLFACKRINLSSSRG